MKHCRGFTLIELMTVLAIFAIVLTMGVPSLQTLLQNNRLATQYNDLLIALTLARSEAIKAGSTVTICGSTDNATCNTTSWELGWVTFTDLNADQTVNGTDTILRVGSALGGTNTIRSVNFNNLGFIKYSADGLMRGGNDSGTFKVCDVRGAAFARAVNINSVGRVNRALDTDASNTVNIITNAGAPGPDIACP